MNVSCSCLGIGPAVYIDHKPDGYPGLKADARAIRAGEGPGGPRGLCRLAGVGRAVVLGPGTDLAPITAEPLKPKPAPDRLHSLPLARLRSDSVVR
jgi:hypothetical protein